MISFKEHAWHNSLYLDTKGEFEFLKSSEWFSLSTNLSFRRRMILKFQEKKFQFLKNH